MGHAQDLDLRIDGKRVTRFRVGGEATGTRGPATWNGEIVGDTPYAAIALEVGAGISLVGFVEIELHAISRPWVPRPGQIKVG